MAKSETDFGVGYPIAIGRGVIDSLHAYLLDLPRSFRLALITDSTVGPLYAERLRAGLGREVETITIEPGESRKTRETWGAITDRLLELRFGRDTALLALGGGVVGDLTGFVAGTYMRGIKYIQIPTTLLSMVDASIGGKTGVDTPGGKNMVGVFHRPSTVVIDPQVLDTLPLSHLRSGFAEVIKHGVIADLDYFTQVAGSVGRLVAPEGRSSEALTSLIAQSVQIKADVVASDERESGRRRILNFGHTIGHAVETASSYSLLHGEAVSIGMALESRLAERAGIAEKGTAHKLDTVLTNAGLPRLVPSGISADEMMELMQLDKKNRDRKIEFALPVRIGKMFEGDGRWSVPLDAALIREVLIEKN
ncbi:MAG: 3-dehydroquinate synthase [Gemmatimonadaceae bacterium]|nr:3-dehydroquinate synthase [Gemmatimonadaceae bacterium]